MADAQPPRKPCGFCHFCNFPGHTEENCNRLRALGSLNRMSLFPLPKKRKSHRIFRGGKAKKGIQDCCRGSRLQSSAPSAATTTIVATPSNKEEKKQE
ncbi:unnamed protein product [Penicillium roqueforti FM164]|uniref:Genomic scaffold, ProqFM164S03 n=1 Tax=Penicillium roqueforti (strain FM164) TaxID=1365484 RepID=W6QC79_PENRF|nr:unnamed protein product [Penicillium roqueforti FM164]